MGDGEKEEGERREGRNCRKDGKWRDKEGAGHEEEGRQMRRDGGKGVKQ